MEDLWLLVWLWLVGLGLREVRAQDVGRAFVGHWARLELVGLGSVDLYLLNNVTTDISLP